MGVAIASIAAAQTASSKSPQTFEARTPRDAGSRYATRILQGYLTDAGGQISVHGVTRNAGSHRTEATWTIASRDIMTLAVEVAKRTGAPVAPYTSSNRAGIEAYFRGLTAPDVAAAEAMLRDAVRLDNQYGAATLALHDLLVQTNRPAEAQALVPSLRNARLTPAERARLPVLTASGPRQQVEAMIALARVRPGDAEVWRQTAERAMNHRLYAQAVTAFDEMLQLNPADEVALNLRGYALTYSGDVEGARRAFAEYRSRLPGSVNAIDSTAEMLFYFRRYAEAAKLFAEVYAKHPETLAGAEALRAACSHYLAGNLAESDRLFSAFVSNPKDVRYAIWRRWTGRTVADAPAALLSLWALQDGNRKSAAEQAVAARQQPGSPLMANLASIAALLSMPSTTPDQWRDRFRQIVALPQPVRDRLLGWALFLDNHAVEAAAQWRPVFERSGDSDNEPRVLLAASLAASGKHEEARKVMPHGFFPPQNLNPTLDTVLYPLAMKLVRSPAVAAK